MIRIERLETVVCRYPLETPVQTSFGLMADANPLRSEPVGDLLSKERGKACLGHAPSLGYEPDLVSVQQYRVS
jgi:hypothetical protein